jgi:hypothetical protein
LQENIYNRSVQLRTAVSEHIRCSVIGAKCFAKWVTTPSSSTSRLDGFVLATTWGPGLELHVFYCTDAFNPASLIHSIGALQLHGLRPETCKEQRSFGPKRSAAEVWLMGPAARNLEKNNLAACQFFIFQSVAGP